MTLPRVRSVNQEPIVYNDNEPTRVQTCDDDASLFPVKPASHWGPVLENWGSQKGLGDAWVSFHPMGPIPEMIRSLWKSDWITNFSPAHDFSIGFHERSCFDRIMIPSDPARYVDRCCIRNFITTVGHFISNITIVKIQKLQGKIYWKMISLVSTVCIFSMTLITYTYLSNMACPNLVVSWGNTVYVHWTGHDALLSQISEEFHL